MSVNWFSPVNLLGNRFAFAVDFDVTAYSRSTEPDFWISLWYCLGRKFEVHILAKLLLMYCVACNFHGVQNRRSSDAVSHSLLPRRSQWNRGRLFTGRAGVGQSESTRDTKGWLRQPLRMVRNLVSDVLSEANHWRRTLRLLPNLTINIQRCSIPLSHAPIWF